MSRCEECGDETTTSRHRMVEVMVRGCESCARHHVVCAGCAGDLDMLGPGGRVFLHCPDSARLGLELAGMTHLLDEGKARRVIARFDGEPQDSHTSERAHAAAVAARVAVKSVGFEGGALFIELAGGQQIRGRATVPGG